jgi:enamine deaminase RidA (YjgF/YER057c/UK114 family)
MGVVLQLQLLPERPAAWPDDVLGVATYGSRVASGPDCAEAVPLAAIDMPIADRAPDVIEAWRSAGPIRSGRAGGASWRANDAWMFVAVQVEERTSLRSATEAAYRSLFEVLATQDYAYPVRIWNYIADINGESDGLERYRQFNIGRQAAFLGCGREVSGNSVPAACALGTRPGAPLVVYALAGRTAPLAIENPRQRSAYHYPSRYGPRAPTFSRASLADWDGGPALFVSGTASIVGHETLHVGDVAEQTRETLRNIAALLDEARRVRGAAWDLRDLRYKAYVRDPADVATVRAEIARACGTAPDCLYLLADICRRDLLVEIEAVALPGAEAGCAA